MIILLYLIVALYFSTSTNISSEYESASTSEITAIEKNAGSIQKRKKRSSNSDMIETLSAIMREPIKIDTTSLQIENIVQSQDNLSHIMTLIGNLLREFPNNEEVFWITFITVNF